MEATATGRQQPRRSTVPQRSGRGPEDRASARVSVIILTHNEEVNLPPCLDSLAGLLCDVFIVDSFSSDSTPEIAATRGVTIEQHPFDNYASQRNWAQENLPFDAGWVLHLDADERLTPLLVAEINAVLEDPPAGVHGFLFRKRTIFQGRWIRHGGHYPSFHLRLFKRDRGRCEDRLYDQHFLVDGRVQKLKHDYMDVVASTISVWTTRHVRWAALEAHEIAQAIQSDGQVRARLMGNPIERRRWLRKTYGRGPIFARAFLYWAYRYFIRFGFLDGREGLVFHFLQGLWFRFLVDALVLEQRRLRRDAAK